MSTYIGYRRHRHFTATSQPPEDWVAFEADDYPTRETHGYIYNFVIGTFSSMRVARFAARYILQNQHVKTVKEWETLFEKQKDSPMAGVQL